MEDAISSARSAYIAAYIARNPNSKRQLEEAEAFLPGGNTRSVLYYDPFPLTITRGQGCHLWDADDHAYVDFLGEFTAGIYGHSDPVIRAAVMEAMDNGINLSSHNRYEAQLARLVTARFPSMRRIRFTNSGTEANLMAIAAAKAFTGRDAVLVFKGGYHGGVMTFAGGAAPCNVPHAFIYARYNDIASVEQALTQQSLAQHSDNLAAILVEPMQGAAGCIPGDPAFLACLRDIATQRGALLIFDEVMTSRLAPGGRQELLGIVPDLTTLGKYIGGGMSFGAFGGREDVMSLFDPRRQGGLPHAGTFNNNVMSMAAGIAGLTKLYTPEAAKTLNARGDALRERLNALCAEHGVDIGFTGLGSLMNLHGTAAPVRSIDDLTTSCSAVRDLFFFHMIEHGFYVARRGFIALSLPLEERHIDAFANAVEAFVLTHRGRLAQKR